MLLKNFRISLCKLIIKFGVIHFYSFFTYPCVYRLVVKIILLLLFGEQLGHGVR